MTRRNAALELLLADLRDELLTAPSETRSSEHVAMMRFEAQVRAPSARRSPEPARADWVQRPAFGAQMRRRVQRATSTRARRFAALFAAICVMSGSVGLDAAGALPGAVRELTDHITDTIVHTFSVPQASDPRSEGPSVRIAAPNGIDGAQPSGPANPPSSVTSGSGSTSTVSPPSSTPNVDAGQTPASDAPTVTSITPSSPQPGSGPPSGTHRPPKKNMQKDPDTPPGLPADWNPRAVAAARAQLATCAQSTDLAPAGCPQIATVDAGVTPANVHWTLLNQPLAGATAIARANGVAHQAAISVYGLFQLQASYTVGTDPQVHNAYSSGVAQATMTWDGSTLLGVTFTSGSVADHLPSGIHVPAFERPAVTDAAVLSAVQAGFAGWVTGNGGTLVGDPTLGAVVSFDSAHGNFTVSGTYSSAPIDGSAPAASHAYTASLVANGTVLQLLGIAGV